MPKEHSFRVRLEDGAIVSERPDGTIERVAVSALAAVLIETDDSGPWGTDLWWILTGADGTGCIYPGGADGEQQILAVLQTLPGFDNASLIAAMTSTANQRFLCWKRAASPERDRPGSDTQT